MKILYVEDNPVDIDLMLRQFNKDAPHIDVETAKSQNEALKQIQSPDFANFDLVLADMHLQDGDGIAILSHIRGHSIPVAMVLLTGQGDEESAVAALKAGADDYIIKKSGYLDNLPHLLENAIIAYRAGQDKLIHALNVLYVEHNMADVDLTRRHLARHAAHIHMDAIHSVTEFCRVINNAKRLAAYDVLLLDYRLPGENALELLKTIKRSAYSVIPVILITGKGDEEIAVNALKMGAFDYVTKNYGYLFKMPSVIENAYNSSQLARKHEALIESEQRYRCLFQDNHMVMLVTDPESGVIIDANAAATQFYGWTKDELTAKNIADITVLPTADTGKQMPAAFEPASNHSFSRHRRADGSIRDVEVYSGPIQVNRQELLYSMIYDISRRLQNRNEKEKLRKQLLQAQKMEAFGQLAGGIAHDFNNILFSLIGFTELALEDVPKNSNVHDNLTEVYIAANRAKDLVRQMLTFARKSDEARTPVQVNAVAGEVLKFIRSSIPATIEIKSCIDCDSSIMGNATQVHQVLMNLCTNAAQAMENDGGVLEVSLRQVKINNLASISSLNLPPGNYIEIRVGDTGKGIEPDILDSIFEPYFTTKPPGEGTGMGLAVVHGIIDGYGGRISVDSILGQGTLFTIYLPTTANRDKQSKHGAKALPIGAERILFVDDDISITKMGKQILARLGYAVTACNSSMGALEIFRIQPDEFDLVITDMTMPRMTGDKLAVELMKIRPDIPVILCTGFSKKISDKSATALGIRALAYKPINKSELAQTVRKVLDGGCSFL